MSIDSCALGHRLKRKLKGDVDFGVNARTLCGTPGSTCYATPLGVVKPRDIEDVLETVGLCRHFGAPITCRRCDGSRQGHCAAVIIDFSKYMNRVLGIDSRRKLARVQPGIVHANLQEAASKFHLTFGPGPASHKGCTIGGMIGNNSCLHSQMTGGRTIHNIEMLTLLLYDGTQMSVGITKDRELEQIIRAGGRRGEIYSRLKKLRDSYAQLNSNRCPGVARRVTGYNLHELLPEKGFHVARALVGSHGTCASVVDATLNLVHCPPERSLLVLGYPEIFQAGDHLAEVTAAGPVGLEALDSKCVFARSKGDLQVNHMALLPEGPCFLLVEFGGDTRPESVATARKLMSQLKRQPAPPSMKLICDKEQEQQIWNFREFVLAAPFSTPGQAERWEGSEDLAVPPDKIGPYLRDLGKLFAKYHYPGSLHGHFGHGCIHTRINFGLHTGVKRWHSFLNETSELVIKYGGSFSTETVDGKARAEFLSEMFGPELIRAFEEFKSIWDPDWKMNPDQVPLPYRYGPVFHPTKRKTRFRFLEHSIGFSHAMETCRLPQIRRACPVRGHLCR